MSFKQATTEAPASADFIAYKQIGGWVIIQRRSDGIFDVCANTNSIGYDFFVAGVSARKQSLWSLESRQFICGDVGQLDDDCFFDETPGEGYAYRNYAGQGA